MTQLFADGYISDAARTTAEAKQAMEDQRDVIAEGPGQSTETTLTISSGLVTATVAQHAIDTEAAAPSDFLTNIAQTNHPDGRWLLIHAANDSRVVTVVHSAGGTGQISLAGGVECVLNSTSLYLLLQRVGTIWKEVMRTTLSSGVRSMQWFSGNGTWTRPAGVRAVVVEVIGGGGAGGGTPTTGGGQSAAGGGGGAGGYVVSMLLNAAAFTSAAITIGAGGVPVAGAGGGGGGTSTWNDGSNVIQGGGGGGGQVGALATVASVSGGAGGGGTSAGGQLNWTGSPGHYGLAFAAGVAGVGGNGGGTRFGGAGLGGLQAAGNAAGANTGGGGGGAGAGASVGERAGGLGAAGFVIVWEYGS